MHAIVGGIVAFAMAAMLVTTARAHSLEELQAKLRKNELYFQSVDKPAPEFTLQTADGKVFRLTDFRSKVVVLHFIYAGCADVCPLHADRIAEIQAMINRTPMKGMVQFVSISTDPEHDTPEILQAFGPAHGLDDSNWVFLTTMPGEPVDLTRKLVEGYGHKFTRVETGHLLHGVVTHVIDKQGRWRANFYGLEFAPVNLTLFVNALTNDIEHSHHHAEKGLWDRLRDLF